MVFYLTFKKFCHFSTIVVFIIYLTNNMSSCWLLSTHPNKKINRFEKWSTNKINVLKIKPLVKAWEVLYNFNKQYYKKLILAYSLWNTQLLLYKETMSIWHSIALIEKFNEKYKMKLAKKMLIATLHISDEFPSHKLSRKIKFLRIWRWIKILIKS